MLEAREMVLRDLCDKQHPYPNGGASKMPKLDARSCSHVLDDVVESAESWKQLWSIPASKHTKKNSNIRQYHFFGNPHHLQRL